LAVGKKRRREETEKKVKRKIILRFPQTFEAAALISIHNQLQKSSPGWLVQVRKPLDGAYAPSAAPLAEGPEAIEGGKKHEFNSTRKQSGYEKRFHLGDGC
jgi:hypothetical protein